jgi:hypothetical protein
VDILLVFQYIRNTSLVFDGLREGRYSQERRRINSGYACIASISSNLEYSHAILVILKIADGVLPPGCRLALP